MSARNSYIITLNSDRVREARLQLGLSQTEFADAINVVLERSGQEARCSKRLVQKWESGEHATPVPRYQKALAQVTSRPFKALCQTGTVGASTPVAGELVEIAAELDHLMNRLEKLAARVGFAEL